MFESVLRFQESEIISALFVATIPERLRSDACVSERLPERAFISIVFCATVPESVMIAFESPVTTQESEVTTAFVVPIAPERVIKFEATTPERAERFVLVVARFPERVSTVIMTV